MHVHFEDLKKFCKQVYQRVGVPDDEAEIVADLPSDRDFENPDIHDLGVTLKPRKYYFADV